MPRPRATAVAAVLLAAVSAVAVGVSLRASNDRLLGQIGGRPSALLQPAADSRPVAELAGVTGWVNSAPLTFAELGARRRVVLVDFWTYTCINCRRTVPFLRRLHDAYADRGLTVIGVHSPEFDFEKIPDNVVRAVEEQGITWPVAEDPNHDVWDAFGNQYWPAKYLVDAEGRLRGQHIGEGGEVELEAAVRELLADAGHDPGPPLGESPDAAERPGLAGDRITPELYLGAQRGAPYYAPPGPVPPGVIASREPRPGERDQVRLGGRWRGGIEYVATADAGARLDLAFRARDVYLLAAPERGEAAVEVEVRLEGAPVPGDRRGRDLELTADGRTVLRVDTDDLAHLLTGPAVADGELTLVAVGRGARLFTFTFGA